MNQYLDRHPGTGLVLRITAAVLGGYALSSAWVVLCGAWRITRVEGILAGEQTSWLLYVIAVIWAFSPVALDRVWAALGAVTLAILLAAVWIAQRGA